jgi:hypothetical protein
MLLRVGVLSILAAFLDQVLEMKVGTIGHA